MLVSEAISDAFRDANITMLGGSPNTAEQSEALSLLNRYRLWLFGTLIGENLSTWQIPPPESTAQTPYTVVYETTDAASWYLQLRNNTNVLVTISTTTTVFFPNKPIDGARIRIVDVGSQGVELALDGNGYLIDGQTALTGSTPAELSGSEWMYRADLASWQKIVTLGLTDDLPLPDKYDDLFVSYLAVRLCARNGRDVPQTILGVQQELLKQAKSQYSQTDLVPVADPLLTTSEQSYNNITGLFE